MKGINADGANNGKISPEPVRGLRRVVSSFPDKSDFDAYV